MTKGKQKNLNSGSNSPLRALVLHPSLGTGRITRGAAGTIYLRDQNLKLDEAVGLALAIGLKIASARIIALARPNPATFLGSGKVEDFRALVADEDIDLVVMDCALNPIQQRNLERAWKVKVIDRTGLILEIFGERAQTREGTLQVELAHLTYQRSRLVRTWTHLERQRGGFGFLGGPGERQIESDRRQIQERITRIKKELVTVAKRRALHRKARRAVPYPIIALAGYTNAGKSTLFNLLTGAGVAAGDKLFATLDPTLRALVVPGGRKVILSDTVGFISDLPTELVAAFRATLEEVREADLILHIRDASNPERDAQKHEVLNVLKALKVDARIPVIEVLNKVDLLAEPDREGLWNRAARRHDIIPLSALTGQGIEELLEVVAGVFEAGEPEVTVVLPEGEGKAQAWLHQHGRVLAEKPGAGEVTLRVRLGDKFIGQFKKEFPGLKVRRKRKQKPRMIA